MDRSSKAPSPNIILALMGLSAVAIMFALLPVKGPPDSDFVLFLDGWMETIRHVGWKSVAGGFSEYTPPYIYLLNLAALLEPAVGTTAAVKLVNLPFVISCAAGVGALVARASKDSDLGKVAAAVTIVSPSLLVNSFAYGQCDAIFTSFVLWFVYFAMCDRPKTASLMFGIALSFKLQAIFVSPLLAVLFLWKRVRLPHLLIIPATYIALMLPAFLAGRPWAELFTVYLRQGSLMQDLSLNAPNPWWLLRGAVPYKIGVFAGVLAGVVTGVLIVWRSMTLPRLATALLLVAAASAALLPWVLPKMTARYFFLADLLTIALAFARPRLWPAAVLVQLGSLLSVFAYFVNWGTAVFGLVPMTCGLGLIAFEFFVGDQDGPKVRFEAV